MEDYKYEILVFTDHNHLYQYIDTKNLSFQQINWALELFHYHFGINNCQEKPNAAVDAFSQFLHQSQVNEKIFRDENTQIF